MSREAVSSSVNRGMKRILKKALGVYIYLR